MQAARQPPSKPAKSRSTKQKNAHQGNDNWPPTSYVKIQRAGGKKTLVLSRMQKKRDCFLPHKIHKTGSPKPNDHGKAQNRAHPIAPEVKIAHKVDIAHSIRIAQWEIKGQSHQVHPNSPCLWALPWEWPGRYSPPVATPGPSSGPLAPPTEIAAPPAAPFAPQPPSHACQAGPSTCSSPGPAAGPLPGLLQCHGNPLRAIIARLVFAEEERKIYQADRWQGGANGILDFERLPWVCCSACLNAKAVPIF